MESAAKSNVAAFVTLPGVKDSLSGLLPDEVNSIEDYLQDTVTVEEMCIRDRARAFFVSRRKA